MILRSLGYNTKFFAFAIFILVALCAISSVCVAQDTNYIMNSDSPGLKMTFDGSSIEAFDTRMEEIQSETTPEEFVTIQQSIEYLLVYDLAARRDREVLYQRLDGKTPLELIDTVKWRLEGRNINEHN